MSTKYLKICFLFIVIIIATLLISCEWHIKVKVMTSGPRIKSTCIYTNYLAVSHLLPYEMFIQILTDTFARLHGLLHSVS